jgi:hypothetical protein
VPASFETSPDLHCGDEHRKVNREMSTNIFIILQINDSNAHLNVQ